MFTEHVQPRAEKRAATRQKVLDSAERLFRSKGFSGTTVRQIAADADVSVGTVMAVGDKDSLLVAIFDGWIAAVHRERADSRDSGASTVAPAEVTDEVLDVFRPFVEYLTRDQELSRDYLAVVISGAHPSLVFHDLASALKAEIAATLAHSGLGSVAADRDSRVIYFSYLGILMAASGGAMEPREIIGQLQEVIHLVTSRQGEQP